MFTNENYHNMLPFKKNGKDLQMQAAQQTKRYLLALLKTKVIDIPNPKIFKSLPPIY
jgi:hypothetical protein